ncbi:ATP-grasp domain-containing protein [Bacillus cereus]
MNIHEYQGKAVLRSYGVSVPNGKVAFTVEEAVEAAKRIRNRCMCSESTNSRWWTRQSWRSKSCEKFR